MSERDEKRKQLERLQNSELISILLDPDKMQNNPEMFEIAREILIERGASEAGELKCAPSPASSKEETEGLKLITVAEYVNPLDAEADRLILEGEGVKAWIFQEDTPPAEGTPPSLLLKVCAEDWSAAVRRLELEDMNYPEPPDDTP